MDRGIRNTLIGVLAFISLVLGLTFARYTFKPGPSEEQLSEWGYYQFESPRVISDFKLVDEQEAPAGIEQLKGQWSLLFFGFTFCPDICPTTLSVMNKAVSELEIKPQVVLVSVDPERDDPKTMARYVRAFNPEFRGFTGEFDEIVNLATQVNVAFGKVPGNEPGTYLVDHSASIVVVDPEGRYAGFIKAPHSAGNLRSIVAAF